MIPPKTSWTDDDLSTVMDQSSTVVVQTMDLVNHPFTTLDGPSIARVHYGECQRGVQASSRELRNGDEMRARSSSGHAVCLVGFHECAPQRLGPSLLLKSLRGSLALRLAIGCGGPSKENDGRQRNVCS